MSPTMQMIWIFCNAASVIVTLICMSYLFYACRPAAQNKWPWFSVVVIGATALITGLSLVYPELLDALKRDPDAIRAGQGYRMLTALFVQPNGVGQIIANGLLILAFMPAAERLYGRNVLVIYFACGLVGQTVNYLWESGSGGSSTAIFGLMGCVLSYILRHRKQFLLPFAFIAGAGLLTASFMTFVHDGHGVGLLIGAVIGAALPTVGMNFRDRTSNTFAPVL